MKVLYIVLGVLLVIGGVYCVLTPISTYAALSWLIGLAMLVEGVSSVVTWNTRRRYGFADGWTLAGAIISIVMGVFLLGSYVAQFAVDLFIAYMIAAWLIIGGVARIAASLKIRDYNRYAGANAIEVNTGLLLVGGILIVVFGILCFFNPASVMVGVGFMLGVSIVLVGVDLIVRGVRTQ